MHCLKLGFYSMWRPKLYVYQKGYWDVTNGISYLACHTSWRSLHRKRRRRQQRIQLLDEAFSCLLRLSQEKTNSWNTLRLFFFSFSSCRALLLLRNYTVCGLFQEAFLGLGLASCFLVFAKLQPHWWLLCPPQNVGCCLTNVGGDNVST